MNNFSTLNNRGNDNAPKTNSIHVAEQDLEGNPG